MKIPIGELVEQGFKTLDEREEWFKAEVERRAGATTKEEMLYKIVGHHCAASEWLRRILGEGGEEKP